jgi:hypothetical protein
VAVEVDVKVILGVGGMKGVYVREAVQVRVGVSVEVAVHVAAGWVTGGR